jgi:hypothetical protein
MPHQRRSKAPDRKAFFQIGFSRVWKCRSPATPWTRYFQRQRMLKYPLLSIGYTNNRVVVRTT